MQKPKFETDTKGRMEKLLDEARAASEVKRIQSVLLGAQGISSLVISGITGLSPEHIRTIWSRYKKEGENFLLGEKRGKNRGRAFMIWDDEKNFLKPFFKQAEKGGVLMVFQIHEEYEKKTGKKVHITSIYKLLHRHGWRKIIPRPHHPKGDTEKREKFKDFFPISDKKI